MKLLPRPAALPTVQSGGVSNAASGTAGISPGSWIAIYGSNFSATTRTIEPADIVDGMLPTTLGAVKVLVNGKAAFPYFVTPGQVNILAPADSSAGTVMVSVTNSAGASNSTAPEPPKGTIPPPPRCQAVSCNFYAQVLWAGLVGAGLYQINVVVPSGFSAGDYASSRRQPVPAASPAR